MAAIGGGVGYAVAAFELPGIVRPLQIFGDRVEYLVIESVPQQHQAVAGALGIGDGLPLLLFVLAALVLLSACSAGIGRCTRSLRRLPRNEVLVE